MNQVKKLVVKVGTSTLTHENGRLDLLHIDKLVRAIADVSGTGVHTLLVSSGGPLGPGASSSSWRMKGVRDSIKNTSAPRVCGGGGEYTGEFHAIFSTPFPTTFRLFSQKG